MSACEIINPETGRPFRKDFFKDLARNKECQVRVASAAGYNGCAPIDTTVLAHISMPGLKAMGKKLVPDLLAAWACDTCHGLVDRRYTPQPHSHLAELDGAIYKLVMDNSHYEGVFRTIAEIRRLGYLP